MDLRKVKKLIELLEASGIAEIEIHEGEESVRISRGASAGVMPTTAPVPQAIPQPSTPPATSYSGTDAQRISDDYTDEGHVISAPMVGIFYTSSAPGEPEFVAKGQDVKVGEVLCIIEAMKIMNQIEADVSGKLVRVLVENGEAVEYGQALFVIKPA